MRGTVIVAQANPGGRFDEGIIDGTPKPGVVMEMKTATAMNNGRMTYQVFSRADGSLGPIAVLREDDLQGFDYDTAYVSGRRGFLYWPEPGDELNMRVLDVAGTGDDIAIGDTFGVDQNTGKLVKGSLTNECFQAMEAVTDPTADTMLLVKFLGSSAGAQ